MGKETPQQAAARPRSRMVRPEDGRNSPGPKGVTREQRARQRPCNGEFPAVLSILLLARELLVRHGWARGQYLVDAKGAPREWRGEGPLTLVDALNESPVSVARWEARLLLQRIAGHPSLPDWNAHPYREGAEVVNLLDKAIRELGGEVPRERYRDPHRRERRRPGPKISVGPGGRQP